MPPKVKPIINWQTFILFLLSALIAAYAATYPYLDPNHFNWRTAFITFLLAFVSYIVYHINTTNTQQSLVRIVGALPATKQSGDDALPTGHIPTLPSKVDDSPDNYMPRS